jgi:tRNA modification GTPase
VPVWCVSCETGEGLDALTAAIATNAREMLSSRQYVEGGGSEGEAGQLGGSGVGSSVEGEAAIPTRARHRVQLDGAICALDGFLESSTAGTDLELAAEELRIAVRCMGRLTGAVSVEDLLGVIFKEFCVGK